MWLPKTSYGELLIGILRDSVRMRVEEPEYAALSCKFLRFIESAKKNRSTRNHRAAAYPKAKACTPVPCERYAEDFRDGFDEADGFFRKRRSFALPKSLTRYSPAIPVSLSRHAKARSCARPKRSERLRPPTLLSFPPPRTKITEGCDNAARSARFRYSAYRSGAADRVDRGEIRGLVARVVYKST
jgi:hypothetical protein